MLLACTNYGYILQLLEKEIVAFIGSLQAMIASFISVFIAVWNIKGNTFATFYFQA